jgi:hypothetical protein
MVSHDTLIRFDTLIFLSRTGSEPTKNILEVLTYDVQEKSKPRKSPQTI